MKTSGYNTTAFIFVFILSGFSFPSLVKGQSGNPEREQVITFQTLPLEKGWIALSREVKLKANVDSQEFEKWVADYWNLEWQDLIPGFQSYIAKGDDEADPSLYAYYLTFKPKKISSSRGYDAAGDMQKYREFIYYQPTRKLFEELFVYIEVDPFINNIKWIEVK